MSKYNIGDEFKIKIGSHMTGKNGDLYGIEGFNSLVFDDYGLSVLEPVLKTELDSGIEIISTSTTVHKPKGIKGLREKIKNDRITPGKQLIITMDGKRTIWDVIGNDCEELTDPNLEHSITIQLHGLLEERVFGEDKSNVWESSSIREYLNGEEFTARFADLIPHLAKVRKDTDGKVTEDIFFLLSKDEYDPEETPYPYYKDKRNRVKFTDNSDPDWHWTRSAIRGSAVYVWSVDTGGYLSISSAYNAYRFAPACVIGA